MVYKALQGFLGGVHWREYLQMADTSTLQGNSLGKLKKVRTRIGQCKFTFSQREVYMWNDLPAGVLTALTEMAFENNLEAHLKNLPR